MKQKKLKHYLKKLDDMDPVIIVMSDPDRKDYMHLLETRTFLITLKKRHKYKKLKNMKVITHKYIMGIHIYDVDPKSLALLKRRKSK